MRTSKTRLWLSAILLASLYGIERFTIPKIFKAFKSLLVAVFSDKRSSVSRSVYFRRMRSCQRCPVYDRKRRTCGSPKSEHPELGCFCFCPIKNKLKQSACWAREQGLDDIGWPSNLMPENL